MQTCSLYRAMIAFGLLIFIGLQSLSLAHAVTYGDDPHEHEGVACAVMVLTDDQVAIIPPAPLAPLPSLHNSLPPYLTPSIEATYGPAPARAPPPRAPPL